MSSIVSSVIRCLAKAPPELSQDFLLAFQIVQNIPQVHRRARADGIILNDVRQQPQEGLDLATCPVANWRLWVFLVVSQQRERASELLQPH